MEEGGAREPLARCWGALVPADNGRSVANAPFILPSTLNARRLISRRSRRPWRSRCDPTNSDACVAVCSRCRAISRMEWRRPVQIA